MTDQVQGILACLAGVTLFLFRRKFSKDTRRFNQLLSKSESGGPLVDIMPVVLSVVFVVAGLLLYFGVIHARH